MSNASSKPPSYREVENDGPPPFSIFDESRSYTIPTPWQPPEQPLTSTKLNDATLPLFDAIQGINLTAITTILNSRTAGAPINLEARGFEDLTPLELAVHLNKPRTVQLLLHAGSNPYPRPVGPIYPTSTGLTYDGSLLRLAIRQGWTELAETLITHSEGLVDVNENDPRRANSSPLATAITGAGVHPPRITLALVALLLKHGADPNLLLFGNMTALGCAVSCAMGQSMRSAIAKGTAEDDTRGDIVRKLIAADAHVNAPATNPPLHSAISSIFDTRAVLDMLLRKPMIDVNYTGINAGNGPIERPATALVHAMQIGRWDVAAMLLERRGDLDVNEGNPLAIAIEKGQIVLVNHLMENTGGRLSGTSYRVALEAAIQRKKGVTGNVMVHAMLREWITRATEGSRGGKLEQELDRLKVLAREVGNQVACSYVRYWIWKCFK
ncbi:ankyrin repeat domain-containing protein [Aspergillus mulundensis]|uniref:Uncharacterized protein n=1 Tax=Aspergillus mulundensis TaxID=1810919 RepID=A0A3D8QVD5_9EURO|nr:hypothetical protein DSM5745_09471 [Aspergillus mulundensis]RDW65732.1 hypothetical protein DSM5745_09471 [Aspergillus mulundensis]